MPYGCFSKWPPSKMTKTMNTSYFNVIDSFFNFISVIIGYIINSNVPECIWCQL